MNVNWRSKEWRAKEFKKNRRVSCAKSIALVFMCDSIITEVKIYFLLITSFVWTRISRLVRFLLMIPVILLRESANIFEQYKLVRFTRQDFPWVFKLKFRPRETGFLNLPV